MSGQRSRQAACLAVILSAGLFIRHDAGQVSDSKSLFENVVEVLRDRYYDREFREKALPALAGEFRRKADRAATLNEQRQVVHEFLSRIPASHLGILSKEGHRRIFDDLANRPQPTFGFQLVEVEGKQYAYMVLEGGPAERAGLLPWDRVVTIDGAPADRSPKLDWRTDDAYLPDDLDPPVRLLTAREGDKIEIRIERRRGELKSLAVTAEYYSAFEAARKSAHIYKSGDHSFGYIHFWFIHITGVPELLGEKLEGEFARCQGLVLDLRGRGGNGVAVPRVIEEVRSWGRPVVALVDRQSRSAKDIIAYELRRTGLATLVGERTAGAVIPATFSDVGHDTVLMFPSYRLPRYSDLLELKPVEPHVVVRRAGPHSAGRDPILAAGLQEIEKLSHASKGVKTARSMK